MKVVFSLRIMFYLSWQRGGMRDCRVDCILGRPKFSFFKSMRSIAPTSSQSVGISLIPQSPLQVFSDECWKTRWLFHFLRISRMRPSASAVMGQDSCCIMGVKVKVADRANLPFHVLEFGRSDLGIWVYEHNKASLPLGGLSSTTRIRRLQSVSIARPVDAGNPWTWKGPHHVIFRVGSFLRGGRGKRRWF